MQPPEISLALLGIDLPNRNDAISVKKNLKGANLQQGCKSSKKSSQNFRYKIFQNIRGIFGILWTVDRARVTHKVFVSLVFVTLVSVKVTGFCRIDPINTPSEELG